MRVFDFNENSMRSFNLGSGRDVDSSAAFSDMQGGHLLDRAPSMWRASHEALEDRREVGLRLKSHGQRDLDHRHRTVAQQLLGAPNASP